MLKIATAGLIRHLLEDVGGWQALGCAKLGLIIVALIFAVLLEALDDDVEVDDAVDNGFRWLLLVRRTESPDRI